MCARIEPRTSSGRARGGRRLRWTIETTTLRGACNPREFTNKLTKARAKIDKAGVRLDKARGFLATQAENGTTSAACAAALTTFVDGIDTCLAAVPTF